MVLLNGNKYACETCIKGHRSSTCRHTDRPLFEIKKKGRPVTQCDHCRELRKTKQVHVKCCCEGKDDHPPSIKKGHTKIPTSAAFPLGLPQALGAQVAFSPPEAPSSDSDHGSGTKEKCGCKTGSPCNCCVPRKSAPKKRKSPIQQPLDSLDDNDSHARTPSHILARLAELRPVLPRPPRSDAGSSHDPSSGIAHGHNRHHSHDNVLFSPYGRAYEHAHEHPSQDQLQQSQQIYPPEQTPLQSQDFTTSLPDQQDLLPVDEQIFRDQLRALEATVASTSTWVPSSGSTSSEPLISFPSACNCGDNCTCPGCAQHNGASAASSSSAFSSCTNPGVCVSCIDCTILSLPASLPEDTSLSIYDAYAAESLDDWIRQVSSLPPQPPSSATSDDPNMAGLPPQQQWDYLPPIPEPGPPERGYVVQPCCGVLCKCVPEECECDVEDENGYDCRRQMLFSTFPTALDLNTVSDPAVAGTAERYPQIKTSQSPDLFNPNGLVMAPAPKAIPYELDADAAGYQPLRSQSATGFYPDPSTNGRYLTVSEPPRSRSSSTSSHCSTSVVPPRVASSNSNQFLSAIGVFGYMGPASMTMSSPNLVMRMRSPDAKLGLTLDLVRDCMHGAATGSRSGGSSPSSTSGGVQYAASNPDSDVGYM